MKNAPLAGKLERAARIRKRDMDLSRQPVARAAATRSPRGTRTARARPQRHHATIISSPTDPMRAEKECAHRAILPSSVRAALWWCGPFGARRRSPARLPTQHRPTTRSDVRQLRAGAAFARERLVCVARGLWVWHETSPRLIDTRRLMIRRPPFLGAVGDALQHDVGPARTRKAAVLAKIRRPSGSGGDRLRERCRAWRAWRSARVRRRPSRHLEGERPRRNSSRRLALGEVALVGSRLPPGAADFATTSSAGSRSEASPTVALGAAHEEDLEEDDAEDGAVVGGVEDLRVREGDPWAASAGRLLSSHATLEERDRAVD